jgi:lysozyme
MPNLDFIDISHHQGTINWHKVAASGVLGVIMKATEGSTYIDPLYFDNCKQAMKCGLPLASYHFLKHGAVKDQMSHYLLTVEPVDGERMVIDYEDEDCDIDDLLDAVHYLLADSHRLQVTVYGASKLTDDVNAALDIGMLKQTSLWVARYSTNQPIIATRVWPTWTAWQYSDNGQIDGISEAVDLNQFNGSPENCIRWFGPAGEPAPAPAPEPETQTVTVSITAPPDVKVVVRVNED